MSELKFREVTEKEGFMDAHSIKGLMFKPFYTMEEKSNIFDLMRSFENTIMRDYTLIVMTARYCTNIDFDAMKMKDEDIYYLCASKRFIKDFEENVDEFTRMHDLVEKSESLYKEFEGLVNTLEKKLSEVDMKDLQKKLDMKNIINSIQNVGKKK